MVEVRGRRKQNVPTREEIARLLLHDEQGLNRRIWSGMLSNLGFVRRYFAFSAAGWTGGWRRWREFKRRILQFPGKHVAKFLRANSPDGGLSICRRLNYCRLKAALNEKLDLLEELSVAGAFAAEPAAKVIEENIPGGQDLLDAIADIIAEGAEVAADTAIPVAVLIKVFKYGLEELCPCCKECGGTGRVVDEDCNDCLADGLLHPFPT